MDYMTYSFNNALRSSKRQRGFTLVEVMIAASIGSLILAGVLATALFLIKSGVRTSNYSVMETETRLAFEQLGIDSRMANSFTSNFTNGAITSFTMTIPDSTLSTQRQVTYVYDTSVATNKQLIVVPGNNPAATTGRKILVNNINNLTFMRYNSVGGTSGFIPASTVSDVGVKHIQISISISRSTVGVAAATQVIRSSAFTLRNI